MAIIAVFNHAKRDSLKGVGMTAIVLQFTTLSRLREDMR
jgi:hypothetical protein